jgi:hypothetical protein
MNEAVQSEHVIDALREELSNAHLTIAILKGRLRQMGAAQSQTQPVLVVPDVPAEGPNLKG